MGKTPTYKPLNHEFQKVEFKTNVPLTKEYARAKRIRSSARWQKVRASIINSQSGICGFCFKRPIEEVHHIEELHLYPEKAFSNDNLIGVCLTCHSRIGARTARGEDVKAQIKEKRLKHQLEE